MSVYSQEEVDRMIAAEREACESIAGAETEEPGRSIAMSRIRSRGPAPERPNGYCAHCGRPASQPHKAQCPETLPKPAPVDPVREAARKYLSFGAIHPRQCALSRYDDEPCDCGLNALQLALEKTGGR